jgi:flagellar motor protein MotB
MKIYISVKNKTVQQTPLINNVLGFQPKTNTFLLLFFVLLFMHTHAQAQIYWASAIKNSLVENKRGSFSPQKALGQPDVTPSPKPHAEAWTVQFPENQPEVSIEFLFDEAVKVKRIYIAENLGIGVKNVALKDAEGNIQDEYVLNENYDFQLNIKAKISHIILYKPTSYQVKSLVLTIKPPFLGKYCQVDGIGISEKDIPLDYEVEEGKLSLPKSLKTIALPNIVKQQKQSRTLAEQKNKPTFFVNREVSRYTLNGKFVVESGKIGQVKMKLINHNTHDSLTIMTEKDGSFQVGLDDAEYTIIGFQEGYLATTVSNITTYGKRIGEVLNLDITIRRFKMGENYIFYEPIFDVNADSLDPQSKEVLQQLVLTLQENPKAVVRIEVHSDSRGDDDYNLILTAKRADKIIAYLQESGINNKRLIAKGLGETELRNRCANGVRCDNASHLENRRVELEIIALLE